jgi:hypothetical protein
MVENGTRVLMRMFGSMVGMGVSVGRGTVTVGVAVSPIGSAVPVGVHGRGWKGVGVGEAFGAAVTRTNGRTAWALAGLGARAPHPASTYPAITTISRHLFIC